MTLANALSSKPGFFFDQKIKTLFLQRKSLAHRLLLETTLMTTTTFFLNVLRLQCHNTPLASGAIDSPLLDPFFTIIEAPLYEEIFFRGILLSTFHLLQKEALHLIRKRPLSEKEQKIQSHFRIHLSALIFTFLHYYSNGVPLSLLTLQHYFAGILYGYLTEKYQTLSLSLLAHGINNFLTIKLTASSLIVAHLMNKLFFTFLFFSSQLTDSLSLKIRAVMIHAARACKSGKI